MKQKRCWADRPELEVFADYWIVPRTRCPKKALSGKRYCREHVSRKKRVVRISKERLRKRRQRERHQKVARRAAVSLLRVRQKAARIQQHRAKARVSK